jgi:hypothetical protein
MIFERAKPKVTSVEFRNLPVGTNFIYGGELFLKVINPDGNNNAVGLESNRIWWFGRDRDIVVIPTKVKIVEVTE